MHKIFISGFGGQGIMLMGEILAYAAMIMGKQVTYIPSYGPEMRGGTANCSIAISDEAISSPIITNSAILVAMNAPSLAKFEKTVVPSGIIFVNKSLIGSEQNRDDVEYVYIDCEGLAHDGADEKPSNMIMLGAVVRKTGVVTIDAVYEAMDKKLIGDKARYIEINRKALMAWNMAGTDILT